MNTKKHKSKNRAKPPPKASVGIQDDIKIEDFNTSLKNESEVQEESVTVIDAELIKSTNASEENKELIAEDKVSSEIPKKPKRKKGKKKQEEPSEVSEKDIASSELLTSIEQTIGTGKEEKNEEIIAKVPARKKKSKSGKTKIQTQEPTSNDNVHPTDLNLNPEINQTDKNEDHINSPKIVEPEVKDKDAVHKKKKKKKSCHDSDKSDMNDACTLAFQKLLEPTNKENENDISLLDMDVSKPTEISVETKDEESSKSKKKHKKSKHSISAVESDIGTEIESTQRNIISDLEIKKSDMFVEIPKEDTVKEQDNTLTTKIEANLDIIKANVTAKPEAIKSEDILDAQKVDATKTQHSPKPKAKIAKPVQKKRKGKSDLQETEQIYDSSVNQTEDKATAKKIKNEIQTQEIDSNNITTSPVISENSKNMEDAKNTMSLKVEMHDDILHDDSNPTVERSKKTEDNTNTDLLKESPKTPTNESDNLGFTEVKTGKNKKKKQHLSENKSEEKNKATVEIEESVKERDQQLTQNKEEKEEIFYDMPPVDIQEHTKSEDLEGLKVVTPDIIQYPRSTSQLNIDNNNNTMIQEITISDEIKLGIPIYMPTPIIEGSGETPDVKLIDDPITIKVAEAQIGSNKEGIEKTDIKSKMFEVNKEMEELRRSIERSLAELTGTEICDSKVDSDFEELFQRQVKEESLSTSQEEKDIHDTTATKVIKEPESKIIEETKSQPIENTIKEESKQCEVQSSPPICPSRKSKGKSKKKDKKNNLAPSSASTSSATPSETRDTTNSSQESNTKNSNKSEKTEQKSNKDSQENTKQQATQNENTEETTNNLTLDLAFEPIENFEDALTSSADDVNKTFEIIANEATLVTESTQFQNTPQINVIAPSEDGNDDTKKDSKSKNSISPPKNLLGHPNIPASSNKNDFKKEKNKPPNSIQAKVKIKDSDDIEKPEKQNSSTKKISKETNGYDAFSYISNENQDFVYKYSFRKVFLQSACHVCKKDLIHRFPCTFCSLIFYCSQKHKDEDWPKHQSLCFAVSTIAHLKELKFIYADAQNKTGQEYRLLRMQMILSCEKILKRKLVPWEQEALLYPRICSNVSCREWKQNKLKDCEGCGQISYCIDHPEHLPSSHTRWCKSYALYQKLVNYQQTKGKLQPKLPTKVLNHYNIPDNLNQVLGSMYEGKIEMDDIQYAALTQIATAPLTAAYSYQVYASNIATNSNGWSKKPSFTIHTIATDLQFEADSLNKWEIFFLHLLDIQDLRIVLVGPELNSTDLPLALLGKIRICENCKTNKRRVIFDFHDKQTYLEYYSSDDFITPDIVCAFNPNIQRNSTYKIEDVWPSTLNCVLKQRVPFLLTAYTVNELKRDIDRIKECSKIDFNIISDIKHNPFCSVRPDRNFITDHEMPLLFKNYCFSILCGV